MNELFQYLSYSFRAKHQGGFGIHSPYVFHLVSYIIEEHLPYYAYSLVEKIRERMADGPEKKKTKKELSAKYAQLLFRLANNYQPSQIVHIGAETGLTDLYFSHVDGKKNVSVVSAQKEEAERIMTLSKKYGKSNVTGYYASDYAVAYGKLVEQVKGKHLLYLEDVSAEQLSAIIDTNLNAMEGGNAFVIIRQPRSSSEKTALWEKLKQDERVKVTIELFRLGLIISNPDLQKENFVLKF